MPSFKENVISYIKKVPAGKVVSYGQVAAACGSPRAARQVGAILRGLDFWGPQISDPELYRRNLGKGAKFRRPKQAKEFLLAKAEGTIVPWWRVLNNKGIISIKGNWTATKELQTQLLQKEGVKVKADFTLEIEKYRLRV
jgi:alkylated DNA nucleotide flippase Atl1